MASEIQEAIVLRHKCPGLSAAFDAGSSPGFSRRGMEPPRSAGESSRAASFFSALFGAKIAAANDDPVAPEEGQASAKEKEASSEERLRRQLEECEEGRRRLEDQNLELQNMASLMKRRLRKCKRKAMLSAPASRTRLGDNAEMPPELLEDLNRLCDAVMTKDAVSKEKVSSMKEDKATSKIYHQRCAEKIGQFLDERNGQRHQQSKEQQQPSSPKADGKRTLGMGN